MKRNSNSIKSLIPIDHVERRIYLIRGQRVMLDSDLAQIYGVSTNRLNQQVNRNRKRFPEDFMFQLSRKEFENLMLQNATSSSGHGGRRKLPCVFTEHGAIMAASVLNAGIAIQASVRVVRAFVRLREALASRQEMTAKLESIERHLAAHDSELKGQADHLRTLFDAIRELMAPPEKPKRRIGFVV